jgi:hypothetical protein
MLRQLLQHLDVLGVVFGLAKLIKFPHLFHAQVQLVHAFIIIWFISSIDLSVQSSKRPPDLSIEYVNIRQIWRLIPQLGKCSIFCEQCFGKLQLVCSRCIHCAGIP